MSAPIDPVDHDPELAEKFAKLVYPAAVRPADERLASAQDKLIENVERAAEEIVQVALHSGSDALRFTASKFILKYTTDAFGGGAGAEADPLVKFMKKLGVPIKSTPDQEANGDG